jgi:hypothetical protein
MSPPPPPAGYKIISRLSQLHKEPDSAEHKYALSAVTDVPPPLPAVDNTEHKFDPSAFTDVPFSASCQTISWLSQRHKEQTMQSISKYAPSAVTDIPLPASNKTISWLSQRHKEQTMQGISMLPLQ